MGILSFPTSSLLMGHLLGQPKVGLYNYNFVPSSGNGTFLCFAAVELPTNKVRRVKGQSG
jgi:hypothetical protein